MSGLNLGWVVVSCCAIVLTASCARRVRIGEHVWVLNDGVPVRAFIVERTGDARVRVQFEGCDSTWQKEITTDRITGRVPDSEAARPPSRSACAPTSAARKGDSAEGVSAPVKVGDRVRVRWRGSTYNASVTGIVAPDRVLVHYEGLENAWDEVVPIDRIDGVR
jgi:hypothetical protein